MATIQIDSEYGYVMMVAIHAFMLNFILTFRISQLRRRYTIDYPTMSSEEHADFNCAQRAHHSTLEELPFFLMHIFLAGFRFPIFAAVFGAIWLVGRIIYAVGYWSGKPKWRTPGYFISLLFGMLPLHFMAMAAASGLIGLF